jgi:hypothetical protein
MELSARVIDRDHRRIEALLRAVERELRRLDGPAAAIALSVAAHHLKEHLRGEEDELFPSLEARVGDDGFAVTRSLRREHALISEELASVTRSVALGDLGRALGDLLELLAIHRAHARKEELALYPMLGVSFTRFAEE